MAESGLDPFPRRGGLAPVEQVPPNNDPGSLTYQCEGLFARDQTLYIIPSQVARRSEPRAVLDAPIVEGPCSADHSGDDRQAGGQDQSYTQGQSKRDFARVIF